MIDYLYFAMFTAAAMLMGAVLGLERQYGGHPAGLRTNALVAVGAALFMSLSTLLAGTQTEPTRIASYIVTGIGFLGGGVIMKEGVNVRGMNTAATLWCSAAIGTLCGAHYVAEAALGMAFVLLINLGMRPVVQWVELLRKTMPETEIGYRMRIVCEERDQALVRTIVLRHINSRPKLTVQGIASADCEHPGKTTVVVDVFALERNDHALDEVLGRLNIEPSVLSVSWERR